MIALRPYQEEAIQAVYDYWQSGGGNPLVEMATGTGKSMVIAELVRRVLDGWPQGRVVMLVHVRELVEQNFRALLKVWPDAPAGIYSAGLGKRDAHHRVTFASIQSVFKKATALGPRDLVLVDEAHLIPADSETMYQTFLAALRRQVPDLRIAGFTATPFRLGTGRIDAGDARLFDETVYRYGIGQGIEDGYLSALISRASLTEIDVSSVAKRGGEFVSGALETASNKDEITQAAADEIVTLGADRRSWLVFCAGVKHALNVRDAIRQRGIPAETVTGETPTSERANIIARFKAGQIRCLTNAQVLTTGFDAPQTDLVVLLLATLSTSLYVQMIGRGTRIAEGKPNALILDYAGNIRRHGPVDAIEVRSKGKRGDDEGKTSVDAIRAKECPECKSLAALNAITCKVCGHEWPRLEKPKHDERADRSVPILSTEKLAPEHLGVINWSAKRHVKQGSPDSLCVTYYAGLQTYAEWVCVEHSGFAGDKARRWWRQHGGGDDTPQTVTEALARFSELTFPEWIAVRLNGKYWEIAGRGFAKNARAA